MSDNLIDIVENCAYTKSAIARDFKVPLSTLRGRTPRDKKRMNDLMTTLSTTQKLFRHPSYGWATPWQIEQLQLLGIGSTRDKILKDIEKQTKLKGKLK